MRHIILSFVLLFPAFCHSRSAIEDYDNWAAMTLDYGPDGNRWETSEGYFFGDYEERFTGNGSSQHTSYTYLDGGVLCVTSPTGARQFYYMQQDHLGSIFEIVDAGGSSVFTASYDPWGRQDIIRNSIGFYRGFTGHEMLNDFGLINMNGRLYDPISSRFLSPDNYVQSPWNSQNFNRYSYCLNNPLKYNDPDGDFWHLIVGGVIGGIVNLATNWNQIDGFWQGAAAFLVGAGSGVAVAATGGTAGAGILSTVGVSAASGALTSATNSVIAQTGKNFNGIENVDWGVTGKNAIVGAFSGAAGGATGYYAQKISVKVQGFDVKSPLLRSMLVSPSAAAIGHVSGGTANGLMEGHSFKTSFANSFEGIGKSVVFGVAIGITTTVAISYANGKNPFSGKLMLPKNDGFLGNYSTIILEKGTRIDRYGSDMGCYVSPEGTPFNSRSIPNSSLNRTYNVYEVIKPIPNVKTGTIAPYFWYGKMGGGIQFVLPNKIQYYLDNGYLRKVMK